MDPRVVVDLGTPARGLATALAALALIACDPPIQESDYDTSCARNSDCATALFSQTPCFGCGQYVGAVNKDEVEKVQADHSARSLVCPMTYTPANPVWGDCGLIPVSNRPVCARGRCVLPDAGVPCGDLEFVGCVGVDDGGVP